MTAQATAEILESKAIALEALHERIAAQGEVVQGLDEDLCSLQEQILAERRKALALSNNSGAHNAAAVSLRRFQQQVGVNPGARMTHALR
jgi:hypothetical protein